jgi:hypothetical protein
MYVNVDRTRSRDQDGPRKITIALPLPAWTCGLVLENLWHRIDKFKNTNVDEVVAAIAMAKNITEPLIIHVDDADDGERVQVFIG